MRDGKAAKVAKGDRQTVVSAMWSTVKGTGAEVQGSRAIDEHIKIIEGIENILAMGQRGPGALVNSRMRSRAKLVGG